MYENVRNVGGSYEVLNGPYISIQWDTQYHSVRKYKQHFIPFNVQTLLIFPDRCTRSTRSYHVRLIVCLDAATWKFFVLYCIVLYCTAVLYCIVLYCTVLYCIVLYCIVLYCVVLYCFVLYCIVLYCIVLYCIVLYCIVLYCIAPMNVQRVRRCDSAMLDMAC